MDVLISLLGFLLTIGILVAFHEYGHFWVARKLGVRVLTYSLGFGKTLFSTRRGPDRIEYRVGALPLGGYVRMLDEREGEVDPGERHRAFNRQPLWKRSLIVAAGPAANILLALFLWWLMFMVGTQGTLPKLGDLEPGTPLAEAGLQSGDVITSVGPHAIENLTDLQLRLINGGIERQTLPLGFERDGRALSTELDLSELDPLGGSIGKRTPDVLSKLGLVLWQPPGVAEIAAVQAGSPAAEAGLEEGERIVAIDGRGYRDPGELIDWIGERAGETLRLTLEDEDGRRREVEVSPRATEVNGEEVGRVGVSLASRPHDPEAARAMVLLDRSGPIEAFGRSIDRSWEMTALTFQVFYRLLRGEASLANLSGPVAIAEYAGKSLLLGLSTFLGFLALISLSLAILNLLPIPMLDGGHLLLYLIEVVRGRPPGPAFEEIYARIGIVALAALMMVVFYNDIARLMH
ncbi:MAG: RIP metalloprotease RseP [Guyparkeria sp.]|uniref:RIP metalloprotease RseP n=1 Tax=Guyparkeria sp. TaxID=2035736 RepID=UPI0039797A16